MKMIKKISIFTSLLCIMALILSVSAFAETQNNDTANDSTTAIEETTASGKLDMDLNGGDLDISERISYALQGTATGMLMVFAVLSLLAIIVSLSKVIFYDIPNKKKAKVQEITVSNDTNNDIAPSSVEYEEVIYPEDDTELAAVITAAIAATIESGEYADEFKSGFRVVSFKRTQKSGGWNKK